MRSPASKPATPNPFSANLMTLVYTEFMTTDEDRPDFNEELASALIVTNKYLADILATLKRLEASSASLETVTVKAYQTFTSSPLAKFSRIRK